MLDFLSAEQIQPIPEMAAMTIQEDYLRFPMKVNVS